MKSTIMRITFISLSLLFLFMSVPSYSIAERRVALVIGNGSYDFGRLKNSVNDAHDIAATLKKLGFSVILINDAGQKEMETAIKKLGRQLKKDDVGIFFYAGHGVQIEGQNYLIPISANIEEESDVKYRAVNLTRILDVMDSAGNRLNIIILDACRNNPYARNFRSTSRGLAIVEKSSRDTLIAYSTSPNQVAIDGSGRNSPYTKALLDNMTTPGIPIEQVFKKVRTSLDKTTGGKQVPWYISSLGEDFYFNPALTKKSEKARQITEEKQQKILDEKNVLDANSSSTPAMGKRPPVRTDSEIKEDKRFIAYDNGVVLDTKTNLMWADKDNGANIDWQDAKSYCENYRGGGYSDWRMPTQNELVELYDEGKSYTPVCAAKGATGKVHFLTNLINMSCWFVWVAESRGSEAAYFNFIYGYWHWFFQSMDHEVRVLPVRSAK